MHLVLIETSGNQHYIFATNKLRENVGASELTSRTGTEYVLRAVRDSGGPDLWTENSQQLRKNVCDQQKNPPVGSSPIEVIIATSAKALVLVRDQQKASDLVSAVTRRALQSAPGLDLLGVISNEFDLAKDPLHEQVRQVHAQYEELRGDRPGPAMRFPMMPVCQPCRSSGRPAYGVGGRASVPWISPAKAG